MARPQVYETTYAHDRRAHRHRCLCCHRVINAGEQVAMWKISHKVSRAVHAGCADKIAIETTTFRQLGALQSAEYAKAIGYR